MAAYRMADTANAELLESSFPEIIADLVRRDHLPGGYTFPEALARFGPNHATTRACKIRDAEYNKHHNQEADHA